MPAPRSRCRRLTCVALLVSSSSVGCYLPLPPQRGGGRRRSSCSNFASSVIAASDWQQPASFFEEPQAAWRSPSAFNGEGPRRTSGAHATDLGETPDSLAFFAPKKTEQRYSWQDDEDKFDDLLPPPVPEPVRRTPRTVRGTSGSRYLAIGLFPALARAFLLCGCVDSLPHAAC